MNEMARFTSKFIPEPNSGCWLWLGALNRGYGTFSVNGKAYRAHRWGYENIAGRVPDGLQLDHLCRVRCCVNPDHLEPVTGSVNTARGLSPILGRAFQAAKTRCPQGHPYDGDNLCINKRGYRLCRICARQTSLEWKLRNRDAIRRSDHAAHLRRKGALLADLKAGEEK